MFKILTILLLFNIASLNATNHAKEVLEIKNKNNDAQNIKTILINNNYKNFILSENKYNFTIITIWAKWCGICKKQLKIYNEIYDDLKKKNIEIIALTIDKAENIETLKDFAKNYSFKMALFENSKTSIPFPDSIPTTYFLDKNFKIFKIISGKINEDDIFEILKNDNNHK